MTSTNCHSKRYNPATSYKKYVQTLGNVLPNTSYCVQHNLGAYGAYVSIFNPFGLLIQANMRMPDNNTVFITFDDSHNNVVVEVCGI